MYAVNSNTGVGALGGEEMRCRRRDIVSTVSRENFDVAPMSQVCGDDALKARRA